MINEDDLLDNISNDVKKLITKNLDEEKIKKDIDDSLKKLLKRERKKNDYV